MAFCANPRTTPRGNLMPPVHSGRRGQVIQVHQLQRVPALVGAADSGGGCVWEKSALCTQFAMSLQLL